MAGICYSIKKNRLEKGLLAGFTLEADGTLTMNANENEHLICVQALDCAVNDAGWGRLSFEAQYPESVTCYVYVRAMNETMFYRSGIQTKIDDFLCDPQESATIKKEFFTRVDATKHVNHQDLLMYEQRGRYLYFMIELIGEGDGFIKNIRIDRAGDNFMQTFPELYRERGSFFHRYLSIFSTLYNDFQQDIEHLPQLLDVDVCPVQLLGTYGKWLGIDLDCDIRDEQVLRTLVKEAYALNRMKGTKKAISRIAEIMLGEEVLILERNVMQEYLNSVNREDLVKLYGNSMYDVTMLVNHPVSDLLKSQLMYLIDQFKPIRSRIHIVHLKSAGVLDSHNYLDMNARVFEVENGNLDKEQVMDGVITLV
ncbi:MAG: phage tail protein [bacterium]|nr:phage tail protein [bacterium]